MTDELLDPRGIAIELRLNSIVETVDKLQLMTKEMSTQIDTLMSRSEDLKSWIEVNESRVHGLISLVSFLISKVPEEELGQDIKQLMTILAVDSVTQLRAEGFVPKSEQTGLDS